MGVILNGPKSYFYYYNNDNLKSTSSAVSLPTFKKVRNIDFRGCFFYSVNFRLSNETFLTDVLYNLKN